MPGTVGNVDGQYPVKKIAYFKISIHFYVTYLGNPVCSGITYCNIHCNFD